MSKVVQIALRGTVQALPEAQGLFDETEVGKRPLAIFHDGSLYVRADFTCADLETLLSRYVELFAGRASVQLPKRFGHGELKGELKTIVRKEVPLEEGKRVPQPALRRICAILRQKGYEVKPESVRKALVDMGFATEKYTR